MNSRFVNCFVAVIGLVCIGASGDVTPVPPDPPISLVAQQQINMAPFAAQFALVGPEVDKMVANANDAATVSMVRKWLIDQDPPTATNPYQETYAAALNQAFLKALSQPSVPINSRLNFGIIIESLVGPKANLSDTVTKLVADPNPAISQQGIEAAYTMLPLAIQTANFNASGQRDALLAAIIKAVDTQSGSPLSGPIATAAYTAINPIMWKPPIMPSMPGAMSAVVDANLNLQDARISVYLNTGVPANPKADTFASYFLLAQPNVWAAMTTAQQLQAAQQGVNLVSLLGQRYGLAAGGAMNTNQELIEALKEEGLWINKLGGILNDANIQQVGTQVRTLSIGLPAASVQQVCGNVYPAMAANTALTQLVMPKTIGAPAAPGGNPASGPPTTGGNTAVPGPKSASDNPTGSSPTSEARP